MKISNNLHYFFLCIPIFFSPLGFSQTNQKIPVSINHSGDDSVGQRFAFELREVIRGSNSMRLISDNEADPRIAISVVTLDGNSRALGNSTVASVVIRYDSADIPFLGYYITSLAQTCGSLRTQECARDTAASIDAAVQRLRSNSPAFWKLLTR
jgi:hypothetical protein